MFSDEGANKTAVAAVAAEIMAGLPPAIAMTIAMMTGPKGQPLGRPRR